MNGSYYEPNTDTVHDWKTHKTVPGMLLFVVIGVMAGMFGLGAGWANVPVLNLLMGVPLKVAVGTSKFLLSITDTSAAWVYLNQGCVVPLIAIPSIVGQAKIYSLHGYWRIALFRPTFLDERPWHIAPRTCPLCTCYPGACNGNIHRLSRKLCQAIAQKHKDGTNEKQSCCF